MTINLHIERLVLDGLPAGSGGALELRAALETEIVRVLKERRLEGMAAGAVPSLSVGGIELAAGASPSDWGRQIARTVGEGLVQSPVKSQQRRAVAPTAAYNSDSLRTSVNQRSHGKVNL